ncbi:Uncharacterised protein [Staphylococcus aureus]|nr:Uncharacterised protein [Staphylococcus aureus]
MIFQINSPANNRPEPGKIKFISNIITIKIETEIINQRLLVILSENIPPNDVPITPAIPFTRSANETNDIS